MLNYFYGPYGMMGAFGGFGMLLFWIIVIGGIVLLVKWMAAQKTGGRADSSALDILKERYAKGEINKDEFESKKKDIVS